MQILEVTCRACGAIYHVAESATIEGDASEFSCTICASHLTRLESHHYRVCRMVMPAEYPYFHEPRDAPQPIANF
jgi:transposase-like protein